MLDKNRREQISGFKNLNILMLKLNWQVFIASSIHLDDCLYIIKQQHWPSLSYM